MRYENFSKFGKGRRTLFPNINCNQDDNLFYTQEPNSFWKNADNSEILTVEPNDEIKFSANGKRYVKWFELKPNTSYFLSFFGRTQLPEWTDLNFGILGEDELPFENFHTVAENAFFVFREGQDQNLTVKGQDGEWYRRTYMFTTSNSKKFGFFAFGKQGTVYLKKLYLCEANNLTNPETRKDSMVFNNSEDVKDCLPQNNFVNNWQPFINGDNYGSFVTVTNDALRYSYNNQGCYYFAWLPLDEDKVYTFVYTDEVKKAGNSMYGFIAENQSGKRKWLTNKSASKVHSKETTADAITVTKGDKIAFAVYDGGGEVEFSNFKIFLLGNGIDNT